MWSRALRAAVTLWTHSTYFSNAIHIVQLEPHSSKSPTFVCFNEEWLHHIYSVDWRGDRNGNFGIFFASSQIHHRDHQNQRLKTPKMSGFHLYHDSFWNAKFSLLAAPLPISSKARMSWFVWPHLRCTVRSSYRELREEGFCLFRKYCKAPWSKLRSFQAATCFLYLWGQSSTLGIWLDG